MSTLWELAAWARLPWRRTRSVVTRREISQRMHELLERLEVATTVAAIVTIALRRRWPG